MTSWIELSRKAIRHNIQSFQSIVSKDFQLIPVIKSNAYGHGILEIARILEEESLVQKIAVFSLHEALYLRKNNIRLPIVVLAFFDWFDGEEQFVEGIGRDIEFSVYNNESVNALKLAAKKTQIPIHVHVKIDTGTTRIGLFPSEAFQFIESIRKNPLIQCQGLYTHLASAEDPESEYTDEQIQKFDQLTSKFREQGIVFPEYHVSATSGILQNLSHYATHGRLGIGLFGLWPSEEIKAWAVRKYPKFRLKPALEWKTRIIQIKQVPSGTSVGYDRTFIARRSTRIATLPIGYFDGFDRRLSNQAYVLIRGKKARVLGRVCMNLIMVDVTEISDIEISDEVTLIGRQRNQMITAEYLANMAGTIQYETVTRLSSEIPRLIID